MVTQFTVTDEHGAFGLAGLDDADGERVRRVGLDREQGVEGAASVGTGREDLQGGDGGLSGGQRPRLVEADAVDIGEPLDGGAAAEEDAMAGAAGDPIADDRKSWGIIEID